METLGLTIATIDGQTLYAEPRPEDRGQLAELLGDRSSIEFAASDDDVEGHAISGDIVVDVEGHAMVLRLPRPADAAALRRALAIGAVTATIVGAGAIAGLHPPVQTPTAIEQPAVRQQIQQVPGPALRAQRDQMAREQTLQAVPLDVANPAVPAQALRAEQGQSVQGVPLDSENPAVPAQALHAERDELSREQH